MDTVKTMMQNYMKPKTIMIILIVAAVLSAAVYAYMNYVKPQTNKAYVDNNEFSGGSGTSQSGYNSAVIYYFTASWCPVSKRVFPEWEKFVADYEGKTVNGYTLKTRVVDCEKEKDFADKYNIEGYPTVKMEFDNQVIEYDANVKYSTLVEFVKTTLGGSQ